MLCSDPRGGNLPANFADQFPVDILVSQCSIITVLTVGDFGEILFCARAVHEYRHGRGTTRAETATLYIGVTVGEARRVSVTAVNFNPARRRCYLPTHARVYRV